MKFPAQLIWGVIGDAFDRAYDTRDRRPVELLWQSMNALSAEATDYVNTIKKSRSVFETDLWAPYGTFYTMPTLLDISARIRGTILGHRGGRWIALIDNSSTIPTHGRFTVFDSSITYGGGATTPLLSDMREAAMTTTFTNRPWDEQNNPSYVFSEGMRIDGSGRWSDEGTPALTPTDLGLLFRPQDSNWSIVKDQFYYSGASDWEQLWRVRVDRWDASNLHDRAISLFSFGDSGVSYEVRVRDSGSEIQCHSGMFAKIKYTNLFFSGDEITQKTHSFYTQGFREGMTITVLGTDHNDGEFLIKSVEPRKLVVEGHSFAGESNVTASISTHPDQMDGSTFGWHSSLLAATESSPVYLEFGLRYNAVTAEMDSFVRMGEDIVTGEGIVSPGRRHQDFAVFNQVGDVKVYLEWVAGLKGSLWSSTKQEDYSTSIGESLGWVYVTPEPLTGADRLQWGPYDLASRAIITNQTDGSISLTIPEEYVGYAPEFARILGPEGDLVGELTDQDGDNVTYRVISSGVPGLRFKGNVTLHPWFLEVGEFEWISPHTFSTRVPLPFERRRCFFIEAKAEELQLYQRFGKVLGMPERPDSKQYLDALRGLEYAMRHVPTPINMSRAVGILMGAPYSITGGFVRGVENVTDALGAPIIDLIQVGNGSVESAPAWRPHLLPVGSRVEKMEPIASPVRVLDWISDIDLIKSRVDVWKVWSTFILQIPASIGMSDTKVRDLLRMIDRSKDVHTQYLVEFREDGEEVIASEHMLGDGFVSIAHTIEDLITDDDGEVVGQLPLRLDDGHHLDHHQSLDMEVAGKFDLIKIQKGITQNLPQTSYYLRDAAIDLTRPISTDEAALGLSKRSMRMIDPNQAQGYFRRSSALCFPLTGASPQWSARDGGGILYSYHTQGWTSANPSNSADLHDAHIVNPNLLWVVGDNGTIWESANYGESWVDRTTVASAAFRAASGWWAVGDGGLAYRRTSGTWNSSTVGGSTHDFVDIQFIGEVGWAVANGGGSCYLYRTTDGGDSWSAISTLAHDARAISFVNNRVGWLATDDGILKTENGGVVWGSPSQSALLSVAALSETSVVITTDETNGQILLSVDGGLTFESKVVESAAKLTDVSFADSLIGAAVGTSGTAYDTTDGGQTWTVRLIPNEDWSAIDCAYPWFKIAVGPDAGAHDVARWK